ncbi:MAG: hypothetical protein WAM06_05790, partial [Methyloceanibacter sp.]
RYCRGRALPAEEAAQRGVTGRLEYAAPSRRASGALTGRGGLDYGPHRLGQGFASGGQSPSPLL